MSSHHASQIVRLAVAHGLRRPARGTEEDLVKSANSHEGTPSVVGSLAAAPDIFGLDERKDLKAPAGLLIGTDRRLSTHVGRWRRPIPAARRKEAMRVMMIMKRQADLF